MTDLTVSFDAAVWRYHGPAAWYFVSLPPRIADDIADRYAGHTAGFGSVRVEARIGTTVWRTSLFPDNRSATYLLPVKKAVRTAENLTDGSPVSVQLTVLLP